MADERTLNIGHFVPGIFHPGGVATYIRRVGRAQQERGHTVHYFDLEAYRAGAPVGSESEPVRYLADPKQVFQEATRRGLDIMHLHGEIAPDLAHGVPVLRTVHGHQPTCPSSTRFLKRGETICQRRAGVAVCTWGHLVNRCGSARPQALGNDFRRTRQERSSLRAIPALCVSGFLKTEMVRAGYDAAGIDVLPLPAPPVRAYTTPPPGDTRFLFLGRLIPHKGAAWLLRALAQTPPSVSLDIAGEGEQEGELRALADRLGLLERVTFHGWAGAERVHALVAQSRTVVFPSVWPEPAGLVTLDAGAGGRAVIASKVGGIPEYAQENGNALLVTPGDVDGLARAINRLADDWELARTLGEAGHKRTATLGLSAHVEALHCHYLNAIAGWQTRP